MKAVDFEQAWLAACDCNVLLSPAEGRALYEETRRAPENVLEIGSLFGGSAVLLAMAGAQRLTLIELTTRPELLHSLARYGLLHTVQILGFHDAQIWPHWTAPISFLFLDHDHSYLAVRNSLAAWRRHLKPGARIAIHDYAAIDDVRAAVDEYAPRLHLVEQIDNLALVEWRE